MAVQHLGSLISIRNSSNVPLTANGEFVGEWEATQPFANLSVVVFADKPSGIDGLVVEHSSDEVNVDDDDTYSVVANNGKVFSVGLFTKFVRVRFKNNATYAQGVFRLQTMLHMSAPKPSSHRVSDGVTSQDDGELGITVFTDPEVQETALITPQIRDIATVSRVPLIIESFRTSTLDTDLWQSTILGSGLVGILNETLSLKTGITPLSSGKLNSKFPGRFVSGSHMQFRAGVTIPDSGVTDNTRRWGPFDTQNGYFFELNGTTLYAVSRRAGVDTKVASTLWDLPFVNSSFQGANRYEIAFFGNTALFGINAHVFHRMAGTVGGLPRTQTLSLPITFENVNALLQTADVQLVVTGTTMQRYGPDKNEVSLLNGATVAVGLTATQLLPANIYRKKMIVQVISGKIRLGTTGVTAVTGMFMEVDKFDVVVFTSPQCPTNPIFAIGDGGVATVIVQEVE